jgi:hypothetical protein
LFYYDYLKKKIIIRESHINRLRKINQKFVHLMHCFDDGYDVTENIHDLLSYFVDVHILEDNKRVIDHIKKRKY